MTKLEAFKESCRRDGMADAEIDRRFKLIVLAGAFPSNFNDEIPVGYEEVAIVFFSKLRTMTKAWAKSDPPSCR